MELHIDDEFQGLLPKLSDTEFRELEEQIKRDGVLNPIIVWNGNIVDGHNRYMICKLNGITDFPVKEMKFESREDAVEWILRHQLGRRNLTDFQRTEIALRYEKMIADKARERQLSGLKKGNLPLVSTEHNGGVHRTREEVAKIAGTSGATVARTKYILEHGSEEQIARAEKGGVEVDGRSNSIRAIVNEIKGIAPVRPKKKELGITEEEMVARLYDEEREVEFTIDDLLEEIKTNGKEAIRTIHNTFVLHNNLLESPEYRKQASDLISELIEELKTVMEVNEDE